MKKILNPKECLRRFIEGKIQHNRELHEAGLKNLYFEWEDFGNDILNQQELLDSYVRQCSELRMANDNLHRDIERLNQYKEYYFQLKKDYENTRKELEAIENEYYNLMDGDEEEDMDGNEEEDMENAQDI